MLPSDHDASGEYRPTVDYIFTPDLHANALDPNTPIVVGARGTGKSFWAGVLGQDATRDATAIAYPNLGLDRLVARTGYSGLDTEDSVSKKMIDARVPRGREKDLASDFWQAVIMRAAYAALNPGEEQDTVREFMEAYSDPENAAREFRALDKRLAESGRVLLVTFDALDTVSK